jgi:hypothetical protein
MLVLGAKLFRPKCTQVEGADTVMQSSGIEPKTKCPVMGCCGYEKLAHTPCRILLSYLAGGSTVAVPTLSIQLPHRDLAVQLRGGFK